MRKTKQVSLLVIVILIAFIRAAYTQEISDGIKKFYYDSGKLRAEVNYKGGEPEGAYIYYYENGKREEEGYLKDGKREGTCKTYCEDGTLKIEGNYKKGKRDGLYKVYSENGTLIVEGYYKEGKRNGVWKTYDDYGEVTTKLKYKYGEKESTSRITIPKAEKTTRRKKTKLSSKRKEEKEQVDIPLRVLRSWAGSGKKITDVFRVTSDRWKIEYLSIEGYLSVNILKVGDMFASAHLTSEGVVREKWINKPGRFYIEIESEGTPWEVRVLVPKAVP